jgi:ribonuclease HIII
MNQVESFKAWCRARNLAAAAQSIPYGVKLTVSENSSKVFVSFYDKGTILIQGKQSPLKSLIDAWQTGEAKVEPTTSNLKAATSAMISCDEDRIGIDESGKGDYFGPLVVAAAFITSMQESWLLNLGIKDSKKISDRTILNLAHTLRSKINYNLLTISPAKYNQLYAKIGNLNQLLAWGHARVLENILAEVDAKVAISDQFGKKSVLEAALMSRGREIQLIQQPKAEQDLAVAAASIIARAEFLSQLSYLQQQYHCDFNKGVSPKVIAQARNFVANFGEDKLSEVAKIHFSTTAKVISN